MKRELPTFDSQILSRLVLGLLLCTMAACGKKDTTSKAPPPPPRQELIPFYDDMEPLKFIPNFLLVPEGLDKISDIDLGGDPVANILRRTYVNRVELKERFESFLRSLPPELLVPASCGKLVFIASMSHGGNSNGGVVQLNELLFAKDESERAAWARESNGPSLSPYSWHFTPLPKDYFSKSR